MAVAPIHGKNVRLLIDERDFSDFTNECSVSIEADMAECTVFGSNDRAFAPGLRNATFAFNGLFSASDTATDDIANHFDDALGGSTETVVTVDMSRSTGGRALMMRSDVSSYDISSPVDDIVQVALDSQGSDGYLGGVMLRPLSAAATTESNTAIKTPGTTGSTEGGTTGGGVGHFHLTAESTLVSLTAKIQHSTSAGSTWADYLTFAAATGVTFERSSSTAKVKEHLRATISSYTTSAGTESATLAMAFSRRVRT
jgi:hypothetical protein